MKEIKISNINKEFGKTKVLKDISLNIESGKIYGLLGRNGAGKSTLLKLITNKILPTSGEILVEGMNVENSDKALGKLFMTGEGFYYEGNMKVKEIIKLTGNFYPSFDSKGAYEMAEEFRLDVNKKIKGLSTGYKTIFKQVIALNTNAEYLLLDEPILGLDANHRELLYKKIIEKYAERECCIVISTHLIEEVSNLLEEIIILKEGRVIVAEPKERLVSNVSCISGVAGTVDGLLKDKKIIDEESLGGLKTVYFHGTVDFDLPAGVEIGKTDLQKLFVKMTN